MFFCAILSTCICTACGDDKMVDGCKVVYNKASKSSDIIDDKISNDAVMMTIDDIEVKYSEVMIYILSLKKEYEMVFSDDIWSYSIDNIDKSEESFESLAKENIIKKITMLKVLENVAKGELELTLNNAEILEVEDEADKYLAKLSRKEKEKYNITKDMVINYFKDSFIASKAYDLLTMDVGEVKKEDARVVVLKQIEVLFDGKTKSGNVIKKSEKSKENAKKKAESIYKKLKETNANFTDIATKKSDSDIIDISLKKGEKDKRYEKEAYSLKQDEISHIIETDKAYYILYCVVDNDIDESKNYLEELNEKKLNEKFFEKYNDWVKDYDIYVVSELWNKIAFSDI